MSRTNHHRGQRDNKCGFDFGSKYKVNKYYLAGQAVSLKMLHTVRCVMKVSLRDKMLV